MSNDGEGEEESRSLQKGLIDLLSAVSTAMRQVRGIAIGRLVSNHEYWCYLKILHIVSDTNRRPYLTCRTQIASLDWDGFTDSWNGNTRNFGLVRAEYLRCPS